MNVETKYKQGISATLALSIACCGVLVLLTGCPTPDGTPQKDATGTAPSTSPASMPGTISGTLYAVYGYPIADATVFAGDRSTTTDASGKFTLSGLGDGPYTVTFLKEQGYIPTTYMGLKGDETSFVLTTKSGSRPPELATYAVEVPKSDLPSDRLVANAGNSLLGIYNSLSAYNSSIASCSIDMAPGNAQIILSDASGSTLARKSVTGTGGAITSVTFSASDFAPQTPVTPVVSLTPLRINPDPFVNPYGHSFDYQVAVYGDDWTYATPYTRSSEPRASLPSGLVTDMKGYMLLAYTYSQNIGTFAYAKRIAATSLPAEFPPIPVTQPPNVISPVNKATASLHPTLLWQAPAGKGYTRQHVFLSSMDSKIGYYVDRWAIIMADGTSDRLQLPTFPASLESAYPIKPETDYSWEYRVAKNDSAGFGPGLTGETVTLIAPYGSFVTQ